MAIVVVTTETFLASCVQMRCRRYVKWRHSVWGMLIWSGFVNVYYDTIAPIMAKMKTKPYNTKAMMASMPQNFTAELKLRSASS